MTEGPPTTVTINTVQPAMLVAFRDGANAPWHPATMAAPTTFTATVHGPYVVTVVCQELPVGAPGATGAFVWQSANTLADPHVLDAPCNMPLDQPMVSGHMLQPGYVQLGDNRDSSTVADWDFQVPTPRGSFDLIATTVDRIAVRRAITVGGDTAVTPAIDIATEGTALVDVAFSATNALPGETLSVGVGLLNPTVPNVPARVYLGPVATAKAVPSTAMLATDLQSVSVRANIGGNLRALRRPFQVGGDPAFTLPVQIGGVQWAVNSGKLQVGWTTLPEVGRMFAEVFGPNAQGTAGVYADLDLSQHFLAETGVSRVTVDTAIAGFKPEWNIDYTAAYTRNLTVQHGTETEILTTSVVSEDVNSAAAAVRTPAGTRHHRSQP